MKTPKFGKRLLIAILVVLGIALLFSNVASGKDAGTGAVCPHSNVKWETDGGYEYTDGSAFVTGNTDQITVTAAAGYEVIGVCIKIGGPGGGSLIPGTGPGTYGPFDYGISHVVVTTREKETPPEWEIGIEMTESFCREGLPYMTLKFTNLADEATFKVVHSSGSVVFNQKLGVGQSSEVTIDVFGNFDVYVWDAKAFLKLGTFHMNPELECKEDDDEEEGFTKIVRTVIDCPVCQGTGTLNVIDLGDKPIAWDYRAEDCYLITTTRGVGTSSMSTTTKTACGSKGSIVVVAPADMTIFGDIEGYSTSQVLEADHVIVVSGKEYNVYFTNYNAYADVNDNGKADWHEKLKHNWWRGIWQYEQFCCAGFPVIETDQGLAVIKLPRICFNGVQLALTEYGIGLSDEKMMQFATDYVAADYGDIVLVPKE